jgi:hypothetical protein
MNLQFVHDDFHLLGFGMAITGQMFAMRINFERDENFQRSKCIFSSVIENPHVNSALRMACQKSITTVAGSALTYNQPSCGSRQSYDSHELKLSFGVRRSTGFTRPTHCLMVMWRTLDRSLSRRRRRRRRRSRSKDDERVLVACPPNIFKGQLKTEVDSPFDNPVLIRSN